MCVCVCAWNRSASDTVPQEPPTLIFEAGSFTRTWSSQAEASKAGQLVPGILLSTCAPLGLQAHATMSVFSLGFWDHLWSNHGLHACILNILSPKLSPLLFHFENWLIGKAEESTTHVDYNVDIAVLSSFQPHHFIFPSLSIKRIFTCVQSEAHKDNMIWSRHKFSCLWGQAWGQYLMASSPRQIWVPSPIYVSLTKYKSLHSEVAKACKSNELSLMHCSHIQTIVFSFIGCHFIKKSELCSMSLRPCFWLEYQNYYFYCLRVAWDEMSLDKMHTI